MHPPVTRLFPAPQAESPLEGLYLDHHLHTRGNGKPFVYSNFITSLDGRIAIAAAGHTTHTVPDAITNLRDWRLYQELAGQADLLITSGRYFRQSVIGEAQARLPVGEQKAYADIRSWRTGAGLAPQPDIAIMSGSLDIPVTALESYSERKIIVVTGKDADRQKARSLQDKGIEIIYAGDGRQVEGRQMTAALATHGYQSIYAIAGSSVFHTLLRAGVLDRLYLTITYQLLGGTTFDTLTQGTLLEPACGMQLISLYHDPHAPAGAGQMLGIFEPAK
jgi:riboflavin biosynthesis pyrimidine reductase